MRKISRTKNECATWMIAPMLNGFFARHTAMEKSLRSAASSPRISSVLKPNGATFTIPRATEASLDGPVLFKRGVNRALFERDVQHRPFLVPNVDRQPRRRRGVERAPH